MERRGEKVERFLEVRAMYEPSRIQGECIADAYEHVVPTVRRALRLGIERAEAPRGAPMRRAGGARA